MSILFSLKLPRDISNSDIKAKLETHLPSDIKVFGKINTLMFSIDVKDASKTFDAKARTTNRTYYYYLPAFCLNNSFSSLITAALKV